MPFLTFEHSANLPDLDTQGLLLRLNQALAATGHAKAEDIKSRAIRFDTYQVGVTTEPCAFAHIKLALLSGRTPEVRKEIADRLMAALREATGWPPTTPVAMAVEVSDIDRAGFTSHRQSP